MSLLSNVLGNAGAIEPDKLDAELKIWIGSDPMPLSKKFNKKVNIYDLQKVLAGHVG